MWIRFRPKRMYTSVFLYSSVAVTLLTMLFALVLTRQFSNSALSEIEKSTQSKLNQMVHTSEFTFQKMRMYALRMYSDENINQWLSLGPGQESPLLFNKAVSSMRNYMSSEPYIRMVYLMNFETNQIFSSESGLYTAEDFDDKNVLGFIKNQKTPYLEYFNDEIGNESYLALVVPASTGGQTYTGYLAILFHKQLLTDNVLQAAGFDPNKVVMTGREKEYLLGNADEELARAVAGSDPGAAGPREWDYGGQTWSVLTSAIGNEGWRIYHLTPISVWKQKAESIRVQIIGSSAALLLALLLYLFWQSYRSMKPISDLARHMQRRLEKGQVPVGNGSDPAASEVEWIHSGFNALVEKIEQLNLSVKSSQVLVKEDFLRQWILSSKAAQPIHSFIRNETGILATGEFRMALLRLDAYTRFEEQYDFTSRKLLRFAMANIMAEVMAQHGYAAEVVDFGSDHVVALFATPPGTQLLHTTQALDEVRRQISRWLKLEVNAAVSPELDARENLSVQYSRLYELTWMTFVIGEDRVYTEEDLEVYEEDGEGEWDENIIPQLIQSVQLKNEKALEGYLEQLTAHMQSLPYEECRLQLTRLIYSIMKSFKLDQSFQGMKSIHTFLNQFQTIADVRDWLHQELLQMIEQQRRKPVHSRREETAAEMIEYIRNHLHNPILSVEDIAGHVSMSVNYARQIFKEHFQLSISDFILNQRVEHAKKLLKTTDWTVAEITEQSGFQTKSTFFSAFKKIAGQTPNQYRMGE